jgi:RND superfamily putative drug exporter
MGRDVTREVSMSVTEEGRVEPGRRSRFFAALGRGVVRHPIRVIAVWAVVIAVGYAIGAGAFFPVSSVMDDNPADALPAKYESTKATAAELRAFPQGDDATAMLVVSRRDGHPLTADDVAATGRLADELATARIDGVAAVSADPSGVSPNRAVEVASVQFDAPVFDGSIAPAVDEVRHRADELTAGGPLTADLTGEAATTRDAASQMALVATVSMAVVVLLMLVLFRSPIIAVASLALVSAVGAAAAGLIIGVAKLTGASLDLSVQGLLPIVVLGVGTDYVVFLLFRYRERLRMGEERHAAMAQAIARVGAAVTSSAFAVVVSFSALLLSAFAGFRVLGPALAAAVLLTLVAGLTLVPAVLVLFRPGALFWFAQSHRRQPDARVSGRLGALLGRRPGVVAAVSGGLLAALALAAFAYTPSYDLQTVPKGTESARGYDTLQTGFPTGALYPTKLIVSRTDGAPVDPGSLGGLERRIAATPGVGQVLPPVLGEGAVARLDVLLDEEPFSTAALDLVEDHLIPAAHAAAPAGTEVLVGGDTSAFVDVRTVMDDDTPVIFAAAAVLIGLVLVLMLRSLVAPLYMLASVALGFGATLGASVIAFQWIGGETGLTFELPLIVYLFVASMGGDYNILMIARIREEIAEGVTPREAAGRAVRRSGPAVGAAGIVLAASFAALLLNTALAQIGFAVAAGIFLSAFVMAGLLVPALTALLGRRAFWPARAAVAAVPPSRRHPGPGGVAAQE